ncbi:host attachment family protein [Sphingomonas montanisoli]|uniref:Host attachment protein n=1 Tax=Sphingomonas montanisoli TaxID=2606412 RepID=A0A5D9C181_9SPHN|nr:host attachment family protein [Sphingomonas montanisoli]TZG25173.1 host attachment protein [Sphingomonas montanisoli]
MRIAHDALVLVADGRKSLYFRNQGDAEYPNLVVEDQAAHADLADREMKTDAAGRAMSPVGGRQSAMEEPDYHQIEEDRFAADTALMLKQKVDAFEKLIIVAPPRTLGELRKHYDKAVADKIVAEIDKDFTRHPTDKIEKALLAL